MLITSSSSGTRGTDRYLAVQQGGWLLGHNGLIPRQRVIELRIRPIEGYLTFKCANAWTERLHGQWAGIYKGNGEGRRANPNAAVEHCPRAIGARKRAGQKKVLQRDCAQDQSR